MLVFLPMGEVAVVS